MSIEGFVDGLVIGAGTVVFATFVGFLILHWGGASNEVNRPQRITHYTEKTPTEIAHRSQLAKLKLRGIAIAMLLFCWWLLADYDAEFTYSIQHHLIEILLQLVDIFMLILEFIRKLLLILLAR